YGTSVTEDGDHRRVVARTEGASYLARLCALNLRPRRQDIVDSPADVSLARLPPVGPPGEEPLVVRCELPSDVHHPALEHPREDRALFRALADDRGARLALLARVNVDVRDRH